MSPSTLTVNRPVGQSPVKPRQPVASPSGLDVLPQPDVPLVGGGHVRYANFDYAASAPCCQAAAAAVTEILPRYTAVHRGAGWLSQQCTRSYEQARTDVARFIDAREDDHVVFTRHTTESLNLLARSLPAGCRVVTFESEHHANLLPWPNQIRLPTPDSPVTAVRSIAAALAVLGDEHDVLVAVTAASNVTGELLPIDDIARVTRRFGARLLVDAAQLAPHRRISLQETGADYIAFSGHKLYAPFGAGVLAGRSDWLDAAEPHLAGGGASAAVGDATDEITWRTGPARHEGGSPNVIGAVALAAACRQLSGSWRQIEAREEALRQRLTRGLDRVPGVRQLHLFGPEAARVATATFTVDGLDAGLVAAALSAEHGIGVRDGLFCAHPLTRRLVRESRDSSGPTRHRDGRLSTDRQAVRASIGLGTDITDVDRLIAAVADLASNGPVWRYEVVDGRLAPVNDPRV